MDVVVKPEGSEGLCAGELGEGESRYVILQRWAVNIRTYGEDSGGLPSKSSLLSNRVIFSTPVDPPSWTQSPLATSYRDGEDSKQFSDEFRASLVWYG